MPVLSELDGRLLQDICSESLQVYGALYDAKETKATTYLNDNIVICILEEITEHQDSNASVEARIAIRQAYQRITPPSQSARPDAGCRTS